MDKEIADLNAAEQIRFIKDEAKAEDFFGTHKRVANAVAAVIRVRPELKVLGLIGPWGSGKSTVVKLVQDLLHHDARTKTHFFVYDAWLHQSDPPRRSFLEALVGFLNLEKDERWQERLAELNGQIDESSTTTTPTLTAAGKLILASLFLLPLGFGFLTPEWLDRSVSIPFFRSVSGFSIGITFVLLPLILASGLYVWWRPTWLPWSCKFWSWSENWKAHRAPHEKDSILSLFMNKAVTREDHRVTKSPDPTAIEFQRNFRDLMRQVSAVGVRHVFVIDNLDRLPEAAAVELWTTIRSFFLGSLDLKSSDQVSLPTILLPIDPRAIERMYSVEHSDEAGALAKAFMDKTFDIKFHVPPPVSSGWREYLEEKMKFVFQSAYEDDWVYSTSRLYENSFTARDQPITPRLINTLLNAMGVLWLQWREEISKGEFNFATLAYYAIHQREIESGSLIEYLGASRPHLARFDPDWAKGLAAIHYGVPVSVALQVTIQEPLITALKNGNESEFTRLAAVPGFDRVFEHVLEHAVHEPEFATNAAHFFSKLNIQNHLHASTVWRLLLANYVGGQPWQRITDDNLAGVLDLLANAEQSQIEESVSTILGSAAHLSEPLAKDASLPNKLPRLIENIFKALTARGVGIEKIPSPKEDVYTFLAIVDHLANEKEALSHILPQVGDDVVVAEMQTRLQDAKETQNVVPLLHALHDVKGKWPWEPFSAVAVELLRDQNISTTGVKTALESLGFLRKRADELATKFLNEISAEGVLFEKLQQAYEAKNADFLAMVVAVIVVVDHKFEQGGDARAHAGYELAKQLDRLVAEYPDLSGLTGHYLNAFSRDDAFLTYVTRAEENPLLQSLFKQICTQRLISGHLNVVNVKKALSWGSRCLALFDDAYHIGFFEHLASQEDFWTFLKERPLDESKMLALETLIQASSMSTSARAREEARADIEKLGDAAWKKALFEADVVFSFTTNFLTKEGASLNSGSGLYQMLDSECEVALKDSDRELIARWFNLAGFLSAEAIVTMMRTARDCLISITEEDKLLQVVEVGGDLLLANGRFEEKAEEFVRKVVRVLLKSSEGRGWLQSHSPYVVQRLKEAPNETRSLINNQVAAEWSQALTSEEKQGFEQIGRALNLSGMPWELNEIVAEEAAEDRSGADDA